MYKLLLAPVVVLSLIALTVCAPAPEDAKKKDVTTAAPSSSSSKKTKHVETFVEVQFGDQKIVLGNFVKASQIKAMPVLEWEFQNDTLYNLAALNLNVPTRKNSNDSDYLMWLVGNIPGNDVSKGDVLAEYVGAFPIKDQGNQGVMFILNAQPNGRIDYTEDFISKTNGASRKNFDMAEFSKKHNFGYALSFNSLWAEYDEYADELRAVLYPEAKAVEKKAVEEEKKTQSEEIKVEEEKAKNKSVDPEPEMEMKCMMVPKIKEEAPVTVAPAVKEEKAEPEKKSE